MAELEHHVIGNIDDVADAGDARGFEAVLQPFWRRLNLYVSNDASGEAAAVFGGLNFDFYSVTGFSGVLRMLWRNLFQLEILTIADFTGDVVVIQVVWAIVTDFVVDVAPVPT